MTRRFLAVFFLTVAAFALNVRAEDPKKPDAPLDSKAAQDLATAKEKLLREEFDSFKNEVLKLKQRLETSDKDEDKTTVKVLDNVLKEINNLAVDGKFDKVIESLMNDPTTFKAFQKANDIESANKELHVAMLKLIDLLQSGDDFKENRKKIEANMRLLEKLREIRSIQERQNAQFDRPNKSGADLAKVEKRILEDTKKTLDPNAGAVKKGDFKKSEAKDEGKPGSDPKGKAEAKNDTQGPKGEAKEAKPGEGKESKPGEGKESKPGEGKESKPGEGKEKQTGRGQGKASRARARTASRARARKASRARVRKANRARARKASRARARKANRARARKANRARARKVNRARAKTATRKRTRSQAKARAAKPKRPSLAKARKACRTTAKPAKARKVSRVRASRMKASRVRRKKIRATPSRAKARARR